MSSKNKGSRAERELFHMFHKANFAPIRVAGSGSTTIDSCDLIVGGKGRVLAIECKSTKKDRKDLKKEQIEELKNFAKKFGAEPWIAVKFNYLGWFFLSIDNLGKSSGDNPFINKEIAQNKGLSFDELIR